MSSGIVVLLLILIIGTLYFAVPGALKQGEGGSDSEVRPEGGDKVPEWRKILFPFKYAPTSTAPVSEPKFVEVKVSEEPKIGVQQKIQPGSVLSQPEKLKPTVQPPTGFTVEQLSPYYKQVRISSVIPQSSFYSPNQISLRSDYSQQGDVSITGFRLKSNVGEIFIPQAVADYEASGFLQESDIILNPGGYVYFYGAQSPLGRNIRLNKCTGYLNDLYSFNPTLPNNCPDIDRSEVFRFSGRCQSYILSLSRCQIPKSSVKNTFGGWGETECQAFLDKINYGSCYDKHRRDLYFLSSEWRVWLPPQIALDPQHDRLLLLDGQGLLVDEYIY